MKIEVELPEHVAEVLKTVAKTCEISVEDYAAQAVEDGLLADASNGFGDYFGFDGHMELTRFVTCRLG